MSVSEQSVPTVSSRFKSRLRWWLVRVLRVAAMVYLGLALIMYSIQDKYVFPGMATQGHRDALVPARPATYELVWLKTRSGERIASILGNAQTITGAPVDDARAYPTIIFFYGNGGCVAYSVDVFQHLRRLGANVMIADYPGYGMSSGKPSEAGCYETADAEYDYLQHRADIDPKKIVSAGQSLGGAVAVDLASRRPVAGLITISAFTSLADMARQLIHWVPLSWVLKYRFDNVDKIRDVKCPILIIHGMDDELVPYTSAARLNAAAGGHVTRVNVEDAGHNDIFDVGYVQIYHAIRQLIAPLQPAPK
jgi:pimeloyl-ACP methyl ester carboxylesterase